MLTPEVRAALLSKIPFSVNATTEYTPKPYMTKIKDSEGKDTDEYSIPEEFRPVFTVRPFTKQESYDVKKVCTKGEEKGIQEWTRKVVIGWKNMFDAGTLEEIEYKADPSGGADKDYFGTIPEYVVADILMYVSSISGILDKDKLGL